MRRKLFYTFNVLALLALGAAIAAAFVSPQHCWWLAFAGMGFPFAVMAMFLATVAAAAMRSQFFFFNVLTLLLSTPFLRTVVNFSSNASNALPVRFSVLTYNVKNFDLYNWSGNAQTRHHMLQLIKEQQADVLCFQEFYTDPFDFPNLEVLRDSMQYPYVYFKPSYSYVYGNTKKEKRPLSWGLAIFSRFPIVDSGMVNLQKGESGQCIFADIQLQRQVFRFYNAHLHSVHLDYDDYDTLDELRETQNTQWFRLRNIFRKLRRANRLRAVQAETISKHIANSRYPKILCGDFNDAPVSYAAHTLSKSLTDAFTIRGCGIGNTLVNPVGFFRIDYVLSDTAAQPVSYKCITKPLSDHYPVKVEFH